MVAHNNRDISNKTAAEAVSESERQSSPPMSEPATRASGLAVLEQDHDRALDSADLSLSDQTRITETVARKRRGLGFYAISLFQGMLALVFFIGVLELFFRFAGVGQQEILLPDPALGCRHIPGKLVTWRFEGYSRDRFSSCGLRDIEHTLVKPADTIRIALLGDSATEGLQVPLTETYARLLEDYLNSPQKSQQDTAEIALSGLRLPGAELLPAGYKRPRYEVINFGCSSYSTAQEYIYYKSVVSRYKPDYVVVLYSKGDSLENSTNPYFRKNAEPRPYFFLDENNSLRLDISVLALNSDKLHPGAVDKFLRAHSCVWGVFSQANLALSINEKWYSRMRGWVFKLVDLASGAAESRKSFARGEYVAGANPEAEALSELLAIPPAMPPGKVPLYEPQDALAVTREIFRAFGNSVKGDSAKLVLMTFPELVSTDAEYAQQIKDLREFCLESGHGFLDLTAAVSRHKEPGSLFLQYHFSEAGHELVARQLLAYLETEMSASDSGADSGADSGSD